MSEAVDFQPGTHRELPPHRKGNRLMPRLELVTLCEHGVMRSHNAIRLADGSVVGDTPCPGGSRSTVSGFSPEAVQAAALAIEQWDPDHSEAIAAAALAAAWATDFGLPVKETTE